MSKLPESIQIANNTRSYALRYGLTILGIYAFCSFAFSGYIPYGVFWGFTAILLGVVSLVLMTLYDRNRKRTIEISEEGIREIRGSKQTFIGWAEFHQTYYDKTEFVKYGVVVATVVKTQVVAEGRHIGIEYPLIGFHDLIAELSARNLLPQLRERMKKKPVYFGPLELSEMHLYLDGREIRRDHITKAKVQSGKLALKIHDDWFSTRLMIRDIPNFTCLLQLLSEGSHPVTLV